MGCRARLAPFNLDSQNGNQFFHTGCGLLQRCVFFGGQLDLYDLLCATFTELYRHAHEQAVDAIFAFEVNGAWQDLLLVLQDCFDHLNDEADGA